MTHIYISDLTSIGSDNSLSPGRRQAITWTNAGILLIVPLATNFSENSIEILAFSFTKMRLKVSSAKWRPFCLGLNMLTHLVQNKNASVTCSFLLRVCLVYHCPIWLWLDYLPMAWRAIKEVLLGCNPSQHIWLYLREPRVTIPCVEIH